MIEEGATGSNVNAQRHFLHEHSHHGKRAMSSILASHMKGNVSRPNGETMRHAAMFG